MKHYGKDHSWILRESINPADALILVTLPYAGSTLTLIAPEDYRMDPDVHKEAVLRNKTIQRVPIEVFSKDHLDRLAQCPLVPIKEYDPSYIYPSFVLDEMGENPNHYWDLVPDVIRSFHY
jgi:hypothetical protein